MWRNRDRSRMRASSFSPVALFAGGVQGAWYDPSAFSTLFQDSAGATPVTAVEQPVRLMRDRSGRGNDATAPNDASRPVLRARYNQLTYSEQFNDAAWSKNNATVTANAAVAPDGTTTADTLVENAGTGGKYASQTVSVRASTVYTFTAYLKAGARSWTILEFGGAIGSGYAWFDILTGVVGTSVGLTAASVTPVGNGWYRCSVSRTSLSAGSGILTCWCTNANNVTSYTGDGVSGVLLWGASLLTAADQTSTGGAYQRIAAATDYDTSNPVWRPYLAFDGTDDSFGTSAIDFSGTDEMTVFAGVSKLSDAARGAIVELTASAAANNGAFLLAAPNAASATFAFESKGTALTDAVESSIAAPTTAVLTGIGDISGDVTTLRRNGTQRDSDTGDQGTGNYANAALFIGRRNNASLPLNGRLYSLIVLGRAATAAELTSTETWINGKARAY